MVETVIVIGIVLLAAGGVGYGLYRAITGKRGCAGCQGCGIRETRCRQGKQDAT
jgi:hypothetical protein